MDRTKADALTHGDRPHAMRGDDQVECRDHDCTTDDTLGTDASVGPDSSTTSPGPPVDRSAVRIEGGSVIIDGLTVDDPSLADLLAHHPADRRDDLLRRTLAVGARGLTTMGVGVDLAEIDRRVGESVQGAVGHARHQLQQIIDSAATTFRSTLDPDRRSSVTAQAIAELDAWHTAIAAQIDPAHADSHTSGFLERLATMLGPGGDIETRFRDALDPHADGSALNGLANDLDTRLLEIRDLIVGDQARAEEAELGTQKGFVFEDAVDAALRRAVRHTGCSVERTSTTTGALSAESQVGDFVVHTEHGARIVVEAKNTQRIGLNGSRGILDELDRAMTNRSADFAICVAAKDTYPAEVDGFGVYGDRLLIVDDGEGTMLRVAIEWARARLATRRDRVETLDVDAVMSRLDALSRMASRFSGARRSLTDVKQSIETVRTTLDGMRADLIDLTNDLGYEIRLAEPPDAGVIDLERRTA